MAVKKPAPGTAVKKWDEELAREAAEAASTEASTQLGKFISIKGGVLRYNGNDIPGNKMNVVVLDSVLENHYYTEDYDPDNPAAPVCFAFGNDEKMMAPHEASTEKQHETCKDCPQNEWGTANKGKGKACKNVRRLGMLTEDALADIESAEVAYLKIPVTSVKAWAGYVSQLVNSLKRPPFAVVTEISCRPHPKNQVEVQFKLVEQINDSAQLEALLAKKQAGREALVFPYTAMDRAEPAARPAGKQKYRR